MERSESEGEQSDSGCRGEISRSEIGGQKREPNGFPTLSGGTGTNPQRLESLPEPTSSRRALPRLGLDDDIGDTSCLVGVTEERDGELRDGVPTERGLRRSERLMTKPRRAYQVSRGDTNHQDRAPKRQSFVRMEEGREGVK